jgi:sugar phosphate isomerase/epimerase
LENILQSHLLQKIKKNCFITAPWYKFKNKYLDLFIKESIQPEIGLEGNCLYQEHPKEFKRVACLLKEHGLNCTLHAPFFDLAPGALDPFILEKTQSKLQKAFDLIPLFLPKSIVCHLQYEENKHGYVFQEWFASFTATFAPLITLGEKYNVTIMFENTYETRPETHLKMLQHFSSPNAKFCLDTGHLLAFSRTDYSTWLPLLSPFLGQLHLHDNHGQSDEHLAPGRGYFNFKELFHFLVKNKLHPLFTFEPHSEDDLWATFDYLLETKLLDSFIE